MNINLYFCTVKKTGIVKKLQDYIIPFGSMKEGMHEFIFEIDDQFFEHFENPEITGGKLKVIIRMQKSNTFLELIFNLEGSIKTICDRCLEEYYAGVVAEEVLYFRFGENFTELQDNVVIIPREENRIDVAQYIYEYAVLNLPVKKVHPDDENGKSQCNPDMINLLEKHTPEPKIKNDPVWDRLKDLIN